jgi:ribosomal protein L30E
VQILCTFGPSANNKVIKHHKLSNFHIEGFSSNVEEFGLKCKKPHEHYMVKSEFQLDGVNFGAIYI